MKSAIPYEELKEKVFRENSELKKAYEEFVASGQTVPFTIEQVPVELVRKAQKMTQKELAARTGLAQADISELESGRRSPTVKTLMRLAEGMDMDLEIRFVPKRGEEEKPDDEIMKPAVQTKDASLSAKEKSTSYHGGKAGAGKRKEHGVEN